MGKNKEFIITCLIVSLAAVAQIYYIRTEIKKYEEISDRNHREDNKKDVITARINASLELASLVNMSDLAAHFFNINNAQLDINKLNEMLQRIAEIQKKCLLLISIGNEDHVIIAKSLLNDLDDIWQKINVMFANVGSCITNVQQKYEYLNGFFSDIFDKIEDIKMKSMLIYAATRKDYAKLSGDVAEFSLISDDEYGKSMQAIIEDNKKIQKSFDENLKKRKDDFVEGALRACGFPARHMPAISNATSDIMEDHNGHSPLVRESREGGSSGDVQGETSTTNASSAAGRDRQ